jgi:hypothetical protein
MLAAGHAEGAEKDSKLDIQDSISAASAIFAVRKFFAL